MTSLTLKSGLIVAALLALSACESDDGGLTGEDVSIFGDNSNAGGAGSGTGGDTGGGTGGETGGDTGGGSDGQTIQFPAVLRYQLEGSATLYDIAPGTGTEVIFVTDADLLGSNPGNDEQIYVYKPDALLFGTTALLQLTFAESTASPNFARFDVTASGSEILFESSEDLTGDNAGQFSNLFLVDTDTGATQQVTDNTGGPLSEPAVFAGGIFMYFVSSSDLTGANPGLTPQIFSISGDGTGLEQLTTGELNPSELSTPPSGDFVVFSGTGDPFGSNADGSREIFALREDGGLLRQMTETDGDSRAPRICEDPNTGERIFVFVSNADVVPGGNTDGQYQVYVENIDTPSIQQITTAPTGAGMFRPDAPTIFDGGAIDISSDCNFVVYTSSDDLTGDNPGGDHTVFWTRLADSATFQLLRDDNVDPSVTSRAADNPKIADNDLTVIFDSSAAYTDDADADSGRMIYAKDMLEPPVE